MARYTELWAGVPQWLEVSVTGPCPLCGGISGCSLHERGEFVICREVVSDRPMVGSGWLHPVEVPILVGRLTAR
jgi:hypothetical protein